MAQRSSSQGAAPRSTCPSGYDDPKSLFDKRVTLESKKIKEVLTAVDKGRAQLEADRKVYCEQFKENLVMYIKDESLFPNRFVKTIQNLVVRLDDLNSHYNVAIKHIQDVSMPALGYLPKRMEALKKNIKVAKQSSNDAKKVPEFEYERLENLKLAMLHYFNAKMYLHAKALELTSMAYEELRSINLRHEFREEDINLLRQVFA